MSNISKYARVKFISNDSNIEDKTIFVEKAAVTDRVIDLGGVVCKLIKGTWYQKVTNGWLELKSLGQLYIDPIIFD